MFGNGQEPQTSSDKCANTVGGPKMISCCEGVKDYKVLKKERG